jgi:hypothetical protein
MSDPWRIPAGAIPSHIRPRAKAFLVFYLAGSFRAASGVVRDVRVETNKRSGRQVPSIFAWFEESAKSSRREDWMSREGWFPVTDIHATEAEAVAQAEGYTTDWRSRPAAGGPVTLTPGTGGARSSLVEDK